MSQPVYAIYLCFLLLVLSVCVSLAQQPKVFPLQQHKILWADTVHRQAIQQKDSLLLAEAYYLYGKAYAGAGDLLTSQRWFLKSLAILEPRGDSFNLSRLYNRLGQNEYQMGHYPETHRYAYLALAVANRIDDKRALSLATSMMVGLFETDWSRGGKRSEWPTPKPDSAAYYKRMNNALIETASRKDSLVKLGYYLMIGHKLWDEKRDTTSITYFRKALKLAIRKNEPTWQFQIMCEMARLYLAMNRPRQAWQMLRDADQFLQRNPFNNTPPDQHNLERGYRDYYVTTGDWRRAYEHTESMHELERNSYISDRDGAVTRLSLEYETEKKETLLKAQQQELTLRSENLRVNQRFLAAVLTLLILAFGASVVFYRLYRKNQRIGQQNAVLVREQNHRVKNNLQVISSLLNLQVNRLEDRNARKVLEDSQLRIETMAILQRRLYDTDALAQIDLAEFIPELVDSVVQATGCEDVRPLYELDSTRLSADRALLIGLIVNELTTNACKYAFPGHAEPVFRVSCRHDKQLVRLIVADNGSGLDLDAIEKNSPSFGMRLIQMLTKQLRGTYRFTTGAGTLFTLEFTPA